MIVEYEGVKYGVGHTNDKNCCQLCALGYMCSSIREEHNIPCYGLRLGEYLVKVKSFEEIKKSLIGKELYEALGDNINWRTHKTSEDTHLFKIGMIEPVGRLYWVSDKEDRKGQRIMDYEDLVELATYGRKTFFYNGSLSIMPFYTRILYTK